MKPVWDGSHGLGADVIELGYQHLLQDVFYALVG